MDKPRHRFFLCSLLVPIICASIVGRANFGRFQLNATGASRFWALATCNAERANMLAAEITIVVFPIRAVVETSSFLLRALRSPSS